MPYYGDGLPYYYGGPFATHSSLMTGTPRLHTNTRYIRPLFIPNHTNRISCRNFKRPPENPLRCLKVVSISYYSPRTFHTPLSRYSPHLSTISESPLSTLRRYSPVAVTNRPKRVIDTADIDVSTPRTLISDANHQRNRLRRDRATIKIRSQALKDNPALREHHEKHEKSVGVLLVEKFLIKDKKLDSEEKPIKLHHQVNLDTEEDDIELMKNKIIRRFTRRRSSADIQLDPEQIEREVAYAQVQAKVLDTLVAEEQAEIENEVRRGTLIKKGAVGGLRTVPGFYKSDEDALPRSDEVAAAQKTKKTLKKLKKKKKNTEKLLQSETDVELKTREISTSSDISTDVQSSENDKEEAEIHSPPQMYKVDASNSVGDFSTIWVNSGVVEQFRESIRIPAPRRTVPYMLDDNKESETEVVLPVKRQYVKDTSRNSVYFTVKTPPDSSKKDTLKKLDDTIDEVKPEKIRELSTEKEAGSLQNFDDLKTYNEEKIPLKLKTEESEKYFEIPQQKEDSRCREASNSLNASNLKQEKSAVAEKIVQASTKKCIEEEIATQSVDPLASVNSASAVLSLATDKLPKASKINTDENNAVEAAVKPTKAECDKNPVPSILPDRELDKGVTLKNAPAKIDHSQAGSVIHPAETLKTNDISVLDTGKNNKANKITLMEDFKGEKVTEVQAEDKKTNKVKVKNVKKVLRENDEQVSRLPFAVTVINTDSDNKTLLKETESKKPKIPRMNKVQKSDEPTQNTVPLNRTVCTDFQTVATKYPSDTDSLRQSTLQDEYNSKQILVEAPEINRESNNLSKSMSTESIDFWNEIRGPGSPNAHIAEKKKFKFANSQYPETGQMAENLGKQLDKRKETDPKINVATPSTEFSNTSVIEEERTAALDPLKCKITERLPETSQVAVPVTDKTDSVLQKGLKKKKNNLCINIDQVSNQTYSTVQKSPLKREDSETSIVSPKSVTGTPDTPLSAVDISTSSSEMYVPVINIVEVSRRTSSDSQILEEDDEPKTPTNEWPENGLARISKWCNHGDLSNVDETEKDITPIPSVDGSTICSPQSSPESSKKTKIVRKKKTSTTKKSSTKKDSKKDCKGSKKDSKESKKKSSKTVETLKTPEPKTFAKTNPKNPPTTRPVDLVRMFYTTPSALLTATPRDLSKVRRAKIKRKKHHSRTPSMSSDSTGSTTSTATIESSGSTCTELDDDPDHKRMNSVRSNDSGFDGSPRISNCDMACHKKCEKLTGNLCGLNQKLVAEALQALKRAPSQSSDAQKNSDSSDHFTSGRITPPATNLPRFKKYAVTDFQFLKVLGKGSFGKVLLAELRGTECVYAVKCLKKDVVLEDDDVECTLIERKVLTLATRHPYLCHLFCTFQTDSHLFFVMEYLNGGDLMFHIQKSGRFSEVRARFYAAEIWSGLNFLHKKGIVYRDLKLDNVLLDFEGHIRIADFGMCKLQIFLDRTADTFCGTPDYMAPEIIKGLKYNQAVDWWSYGVLLYEMLTGQSPFSGCDEDELFWSICNERPFIPRYLNQDSTDILIALLEKDAGKRLPGHEIAMHSFFQSLPWDRLERRQLEAPFKPALDHTLDTRYFDITFTAERPRLTPVPEQILCSMDQGVFRGFSYTNPNATD